MAPTTIIFFSIISISHVLSIRAFAPPMPGPTHALNRRNQQAYLSLASTSADASPADVDVLEGNHNVSIMYCTGCRWMMRSAYYAQELLTTFEEELNAVRLIPSRPPLPGGMLCVTLDGKTIWDRKERGRFPETKELKQLIRDMISPDRSLGHSDVATSPNDDVDKSNEKCEECSGIEDDSTIPFLLDYGRQVEYHTPKSPHVTIKYCTGCKWLLRAAWDAQELLTTFADEIHSVTLMPTREPAGQFVVELDGQLIWDRAAEGRHAQPKELKQRIRDFISPSLDLGHSDVKKVEAEEKNVDGQTDEDSPFEDMDDDEATEMRAFYGVM